MGCVSRNGSLFSSSERGCNPCAAHSLVGDTDKQRDEFHMSPTRTRAGSHGNTSQEQLTQSQRAGRKLLVGIFI